MDKYSQLKLINSNKSASKFAKLSKNLKFQIFEYLDYANKIMSIMFVNKICFFKIINEPKIKKILQLKYKLKFFCLNNYKEISKSIKNIFPNENQINFKAIILLSFLSSLRNESDIILKGIFNLCYNPDIVYFFI